MVEERDRQHVVYRCMVRRPPPSSSFSSYHIRARFFLATLLSVYNKCMFSPDQFGFVWPFFVTSLHMSTQFAMSAFVRFMWPKQFCPPYKPSLAAYG